MKVRVLGAHNLASSSSYLSGILVDGWLALDAGSIASALTLDEQRVISDVMITHGHFDHIRDLPCLGLSTLQDHRSIRLYGNEHTKAVIFDHLFRSGIYPDFSRIPSIANPKMTFDVVEPGQPFLLRGYEILPVAFPHGIPCTGYRIRPCDGGRSLLYTGDTGPGMAKSLVLAPADVVVTEISFSNRHDGLARRAGHLTPSLLAEELSKIPVESRSELVVIGHMHPLQEEEIRQQIEALKQDLSIPVVVAYQGMTLHV